MWTRFTMAVSCRWTSCHVTGSVRRPASTTTTSTRTLAFANAAERPDCSGASCSCTAAATQPGSATASRSPLTVPASGPEPEHAPTRTRAHAALHAPSAGSKALLQGRMSALPWWKVTSPPACRGGKDQLFFFVLCGNLFLLAFFFLQDCCFTMTTHNVSFVNDHSLHFKMICIIKLLEF